MKQTPGKIYLADQRILTQTKQFRRYSTFNFNGYKQEHKEPIGSLYVFNEELLAGSQKLTFAVDQAMHVMHIPITGAANFIDSDGKITLVDVEEVLIYTLAAGSSYQIANPYEKDTISFLQIWIKAEQTVDTNSIQLFQFSFSTIQNQLTDIITAVQALDTAATLPFSLSIGLFAGRQEAIYTLKNKESLFYSFIIAGAFEIEGRLMQEKDGLALWEAEEVELEALSNNALAVVLEVYKPNK